MYQMLNQQWGHQSHAIKQRVLFPNTAGSVVLITGGSSGLGKELALQLCQKDIRLIIAGRNPQRLKETQKQCNQIGNSTIILFQGDLTLPSVCKKLSQMVISQYGKIDLLFLNAGVNSHFEFKEIEQLKIFETIMKTNFYANVYLTKYLLETLVKNQATIIVISSLSGKFGLPSRSAYCASKFALTGFFEALRMEQNIDIIIVYPTSLDTPMRQNDVLGNHVLIQHKKREDPKQCAKFIISKIEAGSKDIYIPFKGMIGVALQPIFPNIIRQHLKKAAKL